MTEAHNFGAASKNETAKELITLGKENLLLNKMSDLTMFFRTYRQAISVTIANKNGVICLGNRDMTASFCLNN